MNDIGDIAAATDTGTATATARLYHAIGMAEMDPRDLIARMFAAGIPARRADEELSLWLIHGLLVRVAGSGALRLAPCMRVDPDREHTRRMHAELIKASDRWPVPRTELQLSDDEIALLCVEGVISVSRPTATGMVFVLAHPGVPLWTDEELHQHLWPESAAADVVAAEKPTPPRLGPPTKAELLAAGPARAQLRILRDHYGLDVSQRPREVAEQAIAITEGLISWDESNEFLELVFPSAAGDRPRVLATGNQQTALRKAVFDLRKEVRSSDAKLPPAADQEA